jgi:tripartite-type tricarboxylate transporter receptor subunit TctC
LHHIPFAGSGPANTALLGGHIQILFQSISSFGSHLKPGGGLRLLIALDRKRIPGLLDVPSAVEKGIDIFVQA